MCILADFLVFYNFWRMKLFFYVNYIFQDYYCELYMYVTNQEKNYRKYNGEKNFLFGLKHMPYWEISHFRQNKQYNIFKNFHNCGSYDVQKVLHMSVKNASITKIWKNWKIYHKKMSYHPLSVALSIMYFILKQF